MKKLSKFWLLLIVVGLAFIFAGCNGTTDPKDPNDPEDPKDPTGVTCATNMNQEKCYDPETFDWELNRSKFDGKQMTIKIMVLPVSEYDPFDKEYSGTRQTARQEWHTRVETAYNVKIKYEAYPSEAPWGPSRVQWITDAYTGNIAGRGEVYLIDTNWISTLVKSGAIAELYNTRTKKGFFADFNYTQDKVYMDMTTVQSKSYGYLLGEARPDFYLYYNQELINKNGLPDPATLWNEGKWDWTAFTSLLALAKTKLGEGYSAMGGVAAEVIEGVVAGRGGKFVDQGLQRVMLSNPIVVGAAADLQDVYAKYWDKSQGTHDVGSEFIAGKVLFASGSLWYLKSSMRFGPAEFPISAVPYPTADGDASAKENFRIPVGFSAGYAIKPLENGANGLNSKIIFNILDDLMRGLKPEIKATEATPNDRYRIWLEQRIDSEASVDALMSVQDSKYYHLELLQTVSMTVGNGSHFTDPDCWFPFAQTLLRNVNGDLSAQVELDRIQPKYEFAYSQILGEID